jgi:hypothetical protein
VKSLIKRPVLFNDFFSRPYLKKGLRWKLPASLDELRELITERLKVMTQKVIASITGCAYILEALSVVGI